MEEHGKTFMWPIHIRSLEGGEGETVEVLVGTRASHTVLPSKMLKRLGIAPTDTREFELEDGSIVEREICEARIRVEGGRESPNIVVFGEDDAIPRMGMTTLHEACLAVDAQSLIEGLPHLVYKRPRISGGFRLRSE